MDFSRMASKKYWARLLLSLGLYTIALVMMLWPAWTNGQPLIFFDSIAYLKNGGRAIQYLFGASNDFTSSFATSDGSNQGQTGVATTEFISNTSGETVKLGRSVYYGALQYIAYSTYGLWVGIILQAALVIAVVRSALLPVASDLIVALSLAVTGLLSGASFFASYLMPDIFAAIAILASASLVAYWDAHNHGTRAFLLAAIAFSCAIHMSHLLLVVAIILLVVGVMFLARQRTIFRSGAALAVMLAAFVGAAAQSAVPIAVKLVFNASVESPPFLTARVIADGPGYDYLLTVCPQADLVLCKHMDRLPSTGIEFLWGPEGVYKSLNSAERQRLSSEELKFLRGVLSHAPLSQFRASFENALRQFVMIDAMEFEYTPQLLNMLKAQMPSEIAEAARVSALGKGRFPLFLASAMHIVTVLIAVIGLAILWRPVTERAPTLAALIALVGLGIALNAVICGVLSAPFARYQARVVWLVPLLTTVLTVRTVVCRTPRS